MILPAQQGQTAREGDGKAEISQARLEGNAFFGPGVWPPITERTVILPRGHLSYSAPPPPSYVSICPEAFSELVWPPGLRIPISDCRVLRAMRFNPPSAPGLGACGPEGSLKALRTKASSSLSRAVPYGFFSRKENKTIPDSTWGLVRLSRSQSRKV